MELVGSLAPACSGYGNNMRRKEIHVCVKVMLSFNNGLVAMSGLNVLFNHIAPVVAVNMSTLTLTGWDRTMFLGIIGSECGSIRCGCRVKEEQNRHLTLEHLASSSEAALTASLLDDVPRGGEAGLSSTQSRAGSVPLPGEEFMWQDFDLCSSKITGQDQRQCTLIISLLCYGTFISCSVEVCAGLLF